MALQSAIQMACSRAAGLQPAFAQLSLLAPCLCSQALLHSRVLSGSICGNASQQVSSSNRAMATSHAQGSSDSSSSSSSSSQSIQAIRARIFEQHIGDGRRSGRKAILRQLKGRHIANWYFTLTGPKMPMMEDELEEERLLQVQLARATGSGPPKKGQGKRAGKKK